MVTRLLGGEEELPNLHDVTQYAAMVSQFHTAFHTHQKVRYANPTLWLSVLWSFLKVCGFSIT